MALLPGEDGPLEMRYGGAPISPQEALGVERRLSKSRRTGRPARMREDNALDMVIGSAARERDLLAEDGLPRVDAPLHTSAFRLPPRLMMFVRAKAEMEGSTVTDVITSALEAYAASPPGSTVEYRPPRPRKR